MKAPVIELSWIQTEVICVEDMPGAVDSISRVERPLQDDKKSAVVRQVKLIRKLRTIRAEMSDLAIGANPVGDLFQGDGIEVCFNERVLRRQMCLMRFAASLRG